MSFLSRVVVGVVCGGFALAATIVFLQEPYAPSRFEYGKSRTFEGVVRTRPVPHLGSTLLAGEGKHGASVVDGAARVTGSLIERDGMHMVEVHRVERLGNAPAAAPAQFVRRGTFRGEIVDSKCWLGVMNPGEKKVHRACASLCIRGGIPPMLVTHDAKYILVTHHDVLPLVAETVEITGEVVREGELLVLRAERNAIRRP